MESEWSESNCTICCQNFDDSVDQDANISTIISQTICKIFGILQDHFQQFLACCPNCSSQIVNIHKILQELDQAKLQLEEIIIKNSAFAGAGNHVLDQNSAAEIARNEIIKRIKPCSVNPIAVNIKLEDNEDLNEVLDDVLNDPDWNNLSDEDYIEKSDEKSQEEVLGLGHEQSNSDLIEAENLQFNLKTPVLKLTKLPQSLVNQLEQKNIDPEVIQNEIKLHLKKGKQSQIITKNVKSSIVDSNGKFACTKCDKRYDRKAGLTRHYDLKHGVGHIKQRLICPVKSCNKSLASKQCLKSHIETKHPNLDWVKIRPTIYNKVERHFNCKFCKRKFYKEVSMNEHINRQHPECSFCHKRLTSQRSLDQHIRHIHTKEFPEICHLCERGFANIYLLKQHLISHEKIPKPKKYMCDKCHEEFPDADSLCFHKIKHNNEQEIPENDNEVIQNEIKLHPKKDKQSQIISKSVISSIVDSNGKFACTKCDKRYDRKAGLTRHYVQKHSVGYMKQKLICPVKSCQKPLASKQCLRSHIERRHPKLDWVKIQHIYDKVERNFNCNFCKRKFYKEVSMNEHINRQHPECSFCHKRLTSQRSLDQHIRHIHTKEFPEICHLCGRGFANIYRLRVHLREHEKIPKPKKYRCDKCQEEFTDTDSLWFHKLEHNNEQEIPDNDNEVVKKAEDNGKEKESFICEVCGSILATKNNHKYHMRDIHGIGAKEIFYCELCSVELYSKTELKKHNTRLSHKRKVNESQPQEQSTLDLREFKCTFENCSKQFNNRPAFRTHIVAVHHGGFPCEFCHKNLSNKTSLKNHIKDRHKSDEELKFPCTICARRFFDKSRLNVHLKWHEKRVKLVNVRYKCDICSKELKNQQSVRIHMRTHTGEKPYSCSYCGRRFHVKQLMINHEACHSDEKNFQCTVCNKSFKLIRYLSRHRLNSPGCRLNE